MDTTRNALTDVSVNDAESVAGWFFNLNKKSNVSNPDKNFGKMF
jgi:hypothetical protein